MRIGGNADVRLRKGTKISGGTAGIVTDYNVKLQIDGASVESSGPAVQAGSNAEVRVTTGSSVKGTPAYQFPSNPSRFDVSEGTQTGEKVIGNAPSGGGSSASDSQAIKKVVEASYAVVKTCGKGGELRVRMEVAASGKVTSVSTISSSTSKAVEACALGRIRSLSFPSRSNSTIITTNYQF
jgi:TonB family protein